MSLENLVSINRLQNHTSLDFPYLRQAQLSSCDSLALGKNGLK